MLLYRLRLLAKTKARFYFTKILLLSLVSIWFWITFAIFLPDWCRRYPKWCNPQIHDWCRVPRPNEIVLDNENLLRSETARRSLINRSIDTSDWYLSNLTMAIVAKKRPYPFRNGATIDLRYLTQVTSKLLELKIIDTASSKSILGKSNLFICNVDDRPDEFAEAEELSKYVRVVAKKDQDIGNRTQSIGNNIDQILNREKDDYVFCLRSAVASTTENGFVILFQDDALPVDDFESMLRSVIDQMKNRYSDDRSIFVKFYHPEGYRKLPWLILVFAYSLSLTLSILSINYFLRRHRSIDQNRSTSIFFFFVLVTYFSAFLWCLGHYSVAYIRYFLTGDIYLVVQESCCIPAVLFTRQSAVGVIDYLNSRRAYAGYAVDHMLDEMTRVRGLMTDLNLIRHIGRYTTLRVHPVNADPY